MFVKISDYKIINLFKHESIAICHNKTGENIKRIYFSFSDLCDRFDFETMEQAKKAFDLICEALSQDKKYLDLTKHLQ